MTELEKKGQLARKAAMALMTADTASKNGALSEMAKAISSRAGEVLAANKKDTDAAVQSGITKALLDRLTLTEERIKGIVDGINEIIALPDPVGEVLEKTLRPNGLEIERRSVPLGVIGIIYEARPNVTVDAAALCLKAGNAVILRGGKEAFNSNLAFVSIMRDALEKAGLPRDCVALVEDTSRQSAMELMQLSDYLDVLIPRGGAGLIKSVVENSKVPVIETGVGVCHVYVDRDADLEKAANIIFNAKCSRPSVCNAAETLLVDETVAERFLPMAKAKLDTKNVELRGCERTREILGDGVIPATDADYRTEFGDYILAIKLISGLDEAIDFVNEYGTGHSESIVTENKEAAEKFLNGVDAAAVYTNVSTRFTDGGEFGLGAEIGISTQKLHARGPMGLRQLTSSKFVIRGDGQIR
ncbi:MAG: glutamate-5-semialdehyde dehydrogenase [Clostridiales bacterium]|nr:glutamate-5-semialdehyde dehydrogenase [Clostridiales bacterium]